MSPMGDAAERLTRQLAYKTNKELADAIDQLADAVADGSEYRRTAAREVMIYGEAFFVIAHRLFLAPGCVEVLTRPFIKGPAQYKFTLPESTIAALEKVAPVIRASVRSVRTFTAEQVIHVANRAHPYDPRGTPRVTMYGILLPMSIERMREILKPLNY